MSVIASLMVNFSAATAGFTAGVAKVRTGIAGLADQATSMKAVVTGAFAAIGAAAATAALTALTKNSMEAIDVNAKMADKLGINMQALIGFQHAANLAGSSAEGLNNGLMFMTKNIGLAAQGSTKQAAAFAALGLDAQKLSAAKPEDAFLMIADAISKTTNPYERLTLAQAIFGKGAAGLMNTLMLGAEGLKAAGVEAQKLGISYSRVDAAKVEAANDALTRAGEVFTGLGNQLAIGLAPYIEAVATKFTGMAADGNWAATAVTTGLKWVANAIGFVADMIQVVNVAWLGMKSVALNAFAGIANFFAPVLTLMMNGLASIGKTIENISSIPGMPEWVKNTGLGIQQAANDMADFTSDSIRGLNETAEAADKAFQDSLTGPAWSKKVEGFFNDIEQKAQQGAQAVTDAAAAQTNAEGGVDAVEKAAKKSKSPKPVEIKSPEAISESLSNLMAQKFANESKPMDEIAKNTKDQIDETKKLGDRIVDAISENDSSDDEEAIVSF